MVRWYVAMTHPRSEELAMKHLARQGFDAYLPRYRKTRRKPARSGNRTGEVVAAPLFPGYLFVRFDPAVDRWRPIRSTIGIRDLICQGDRPSPVPDGVVEEVAGREDETGFISMVEAPPFEKGDTVRVMDGPLRDSVGWFDGLADKERIMVLLNMLGRQVRLPLKLAAVRAFT